MLNTYLLVNNNIDMMGFEQDVQIPENQQPSGNESAEQYQANEYIQNNQPSPETLPALPDMNAETSVTNENLSSPHGILNISIASVGILILLIVTVFIIRKLKQSKRNEYSSEKRNKNLSISEVISHNSEGADKSYSTPENIKKCIRLLLENTRIR